MQTISLKLTTVFAILFSSGAFALDCAKTTVAYWKAEAEKKISLNGYVPKADGKNLEALERAVQINARITQAYAGLYQSEKALAPERAKLYLWLPGAAFASFEVGQVIRHAYYQRAFTNHDMDLIRAEVYNENVLHEVFLGDLNYTARKTAMTLIKGNMAVYRDLYWQHMSTSQCGIDNTIRVLTLETYSSFTTRAMNHYARLKWGWEQIKEGNVEEGNIALTRVEQEIVLQPEIYDGPLAYLGGTVFAKLAKTPVHDESFFFPSFIDYCKSRKLSPNFSKFRSRWGWIVDQMVSMGKFFNTFPQKLRKHHGLMLADSQQVIGASFQP